MNHRTLARRAQAGFTLIELMIVVAIIGILAAIAIPQYQTYVAKSQVARVVAETGNQKTAVEDCVLNGKVTAGKTDADCKGTASGSNMLKAGDGNTANGDKPADATLGAPTLAFPTTTTPTLTSIFGGSSSAALKDQTVIWARDTDGSWSCKTTADAKYTTTACPKSAGT